MESNSLVPLFLNIKCGKDGTFDSSFQIHTKSKQKSGSLANAHQTQFDTLAHTHTHLAFLLTPPPPKKKRDFPAFWFHEWATWEAQHSELSQAYRDLVSRSNESVALWPTATNTFRQLFELYIYIPYKHVYMHAMYMFMYV